MTRRPGVWAVIGLVTFGLLWELLVRARDIKPFVLLEPSRIVRGIADRPAFFLDHTWTTAWHTLAGVGIALTLAIALGAVLAAYRPLEWATQPVLVLIMVTPWVAYITSVVLWLGTGTPTILFMVSFVTFPPFVFAAVLGMRSADVAARELLASVDTPRIEVLWRLRLPSALPSLFTAGRFTVGLGLAAAYFSEGGSSSNDGGLGEIGKRATVDQTIGAPVLWGSIMCAAVLGVLFLVGVTTLERRLLAWHASQRIVIG
jgi:NitT/TauT family transport system permease protein